MAEEKKILDIWWMIREMLFLLSRFLAPLIIFVVSVFFLIRQDEHSIRVFFVNLALALFTTVYLVLFLVRRMLFTFRKSNIAQNQKTIVRGQSKKQLGIGFLTFSAIILLLFSTAIFYGTEHGPFRWILYILDFCFVSAWWYSVRETLKKKK